MNPILDPILGYAINKVGDLAISSFEAYRFIHAPFLHGPVRHWLARRRSAAVFYNARRTVPAYRDFLAHAGVPAPQTFEEIPPMDKESYIKKFPLESTCQGGRIPLRGVVLDESSGSSGTASNWVRGPGERYATRRLIQFSARSTFGQESFVLLNAFALGPWATGMNVSMALVDNCIIKSIGPDVGKIVSTLKLLGPSYRYIITGYPPFMKTLVDTADLDWSRYDVCSVVGGEGLSEALRFALNRRFRKTVSSYGASDLEINLAVETDFTMALRRALADHEGLAQDLYGRESLPMVFQYDPLNVHFESDPNRELLCTLNRLENVSPRVRYNIHDRGLVRTVPDVLHVLRNHGVRLDVDPKVPLPLLFHWGRNDSAVGFYGCKITPEDIQNVVLRLPALLGTANFGLHPWEDAQANKRLDIYLELEPNTDAPANLTALTREFLDKLMEVNQDFRESIRMIPDDHLPTLKFFPFGQSPMSGQDVRIKRRYIV